MDCCAQMLRPDGYCGGLEWTPVREAFRKARLASGKSLRTLKSATGIDPSTIHRIENVKKYPDYRCDLDTLDALVRGVGLSLARFFAQVEGVDLSSATGDEMAADARAFLQLKAPLRQVALGYATALQESLPQAPTAESRPAPSPVVRTRSAGGRRR